LTGSRGLKAPHALTALAANAVRGLWVVLPL
jgi:hypothetical protein